MSAASAAPPTEGSPKLRVLVIAELCNPAWVSTPLGGWSSWNAISQIVDGHLVTANRNEKDLLEHGLSPDRFTALDISGIERHTVRLWDLLRGGGDRNAGWSTWAAFGTFSYYYFEHLLWRRFGEAIVKRQFDIVHRVTPVTPSAQSLLAKRCARAGVPFVLGPINGGLPWPKGFNDIRLKEKEWLSFARGLHKLLPGYRSSRRHSAAVIVGSRSALAEVPSFARERAVYIPGNAVEPSRFGRFPERPVGLPVRVAFVGRFTRIKGTDMLIEAAAPFVRAGKLVLDLIGDGPHMPELKAIAAREKVGSGVAFTGWIKHQQLQEHLAQAHVFGFPSIREYGGAVVLEAMAMGLVPVVVDYGGPAELVSPRTGFTVAMGSRGEIVAGLGRVFERIVSDPTALVEMSRLARERVFAKFTWEAKARQIHEVYRWVLGRRDKPDFGMPLADPGEPAGSLAAAPT